MQPVGQGKWAADFTALSQWLAVEPSPTLLPPGIRDLVRARVSHLTPNAATLLAAGALLGQHLDFALLCQVAGLTEDTGLQALDELLVRQLLGRAYELDNQLDRAEMVYWDMLAYAQDHHLPVMNTEALTHLATLAYMFNLQLDKAMGYLQQARQVAEASDNKAGLAEVEWNLAQINFYGLDGLASLAHGQRALTLARELRLQDLTARS